MSIRSTYLYGAILLIAVSCRYRKPLEIQSNSELQRFDSTVTLSDSSVLALIEPYSEKLSEEMDQVIAYSNVAMYKERPQSLLGNFVCDLLLQQTYEVRPDFCFLNYGGLRAPLPKGEIRVRHIYELMPFDNQLVLLKLTENQMIELANFIRKQGGEPMATTMDIQLKYFKSGGGSYRLTKKEGEFYWVLTSDYLLNGGDRYTILAEATEVIRTGLFIRDVLLDQVKKYDEDNPAQPVLDERCTIR